MINYKTILISKIVLIFRFLDLYTTHLATSIDFANQEQNFLVKTLKFNKFSYFVAEVFFAFLLVYFYITAKRNLPYSKATTFAKFYYLNFSFKKNKFNSFGKLFNIYSLIIPKLYITTSIILAINNYTVFLYNKNCNLAIELYDCLHENFIIDFCLFIFPVILFFYLMSIKIYSIYREQNH